MPVLGPVPVNLRREAPPAKGTLTLAMVLPGLSASLLPLALTHQKVELLSR